MPSGFRPWARDGRGYGGLGSVLPAGGQHPIPGPDLGREGRHGVARARPGGGADLSAAHRGGSPAAAGDGGARDAVRLALELVGQGHRPAADLRSIPGVYPGTGSHGAVRLAWRHPALPARRAGGHDLPAPVDLRGARAYGPGGVRDGGLDRALETAREMAAIAPN